MNRHRTHTLWIAFILHRFSGVALVLFLPLHFYLLSMVLTDPETVDQLLHWTKHPLVKVAEFGLVFLLSVHIFGGLRLMALEFLPWASWQKTMAAFSVAVSFLISCTFYLSAV